MKKLHATDNLKDLVSYSVKLTIVLCWNGFGVVSIWRGLWVLQDTFLFPDNPELSSWASGAIGIAMIIIALLIRFPVNALAATIDLWKFSTFPSFLQYVILGQATKSANLKSVNNNAQYYDESQIETSPSHAKQTTPDFLIDKQNSSSVPSSSRSSLSSDGDQKVDLPHIYEDVVHNLGDSINESTLEELTLINHGLDKKSENDVFRNESDFMLFKKLRRVVGKILQIIENLAFFVTSFTLISFSNLMILNGRLAAWVMVKSYYWFLGAAAVAYHRWVWTLWDVYTDGDYFAAFIFVSIIIPTLMLLPVTSEFHTIGGTPITPAFFDVATLTILGKFKGKSSKKYDEESEIESQNKSLYEKISENSEKEKFGDRKIAKKFKTIKMQMKKKKKQQGKKTQVILNSNDV